jgi:cystathionine gamma-synthase
MLAIELSNEARARALPGALALFHDATSLGGVESLAEWRRKFDPEAPAGLVRLAVGLEDPGDLEDDLARGLARVGEPARG